jgi:hypothetical protein
MRLRLLLVGFGSVLVGAAVVAIAQPPMLPTTSPPIPPITPPPPAIAVPPALPAAFPPTSPSPVRVNESPLSRFEPLAACPLQTQNAVRGVLLSANWMTRMNQSHGRFMDGFNPALRQPLPHDHDLLQARAAMAMAQLAKFTGDEKQGAIASHAILTLLTTTKIDPSDPNCRVPLHSSLVCNRVGFAATLAMAIYALPGADSTRIADAEQLCEFLHKQCRPDGSVHYTDGASDSSMDVDPSGVNEYPGLALSAIMVGNRVRPAAWKTDVTKKGMVFYRSVFQAKPHTLMATTLTSAYAELYLQTKLSDATASVFEMNDWLCRFQIPNSDPRIPQWVGGFRSVLNGQQTDVPSGPETGLYLQSLASACQIARLTPDLDRYAKFKAASMDATQYLTDLQYVETNTRHFENAFRANMLMGAFHLSPTDGNIRIDATATAVTGLLRFLESVADRE